MVPEPVADAPEVYSLLDDEYARRILIETYEETRSASTLCEACDASKATVYRRLERLQQQELVESVQEIDPNEGPQEVYAARLDHVSIDLTGAGFEVDVEIPVSDVAPGLQIQRQSDSELEAVVGDGTTPLRAHTNNGDVMLRA
ncbi:helix-turn-helix domain-containing protein [Halorubrum terrestre]|uniref:Helix-turn-helix domain-containing protein n=1 Tax=Halorubrum distributum TaxID=29283 RepID=A0A6B1IEX0_9EURY|nr:helix-turn-helix domain-containing protein [Halorubrum terrestre]MYL17223.1 helix-turn-helix domain-containing protein [Halorubrum terrestre]